MTEKQNKYHHSWPSGFERKITNMLDKQFMGIIAVVKRKVQNPCEKFCSELQVIRHDLEAMCQEYEIQLAATEA
jgi:hypothetical protein